MKYSQKKYTYTILLKKLNALYIRSKQKITKVLRFIFM